MDPLSITVSLIAVLQISGAVISSLYEYRSGVKHFSKDCARIIEELNALRGALEGVLRAVEKEDEHPSDASRLETFRALAGPNGEIERCKTDLEAVRERLGDMEGGEGRWKVVRDRLSWPFREKEVEKLLENVRRARGTMLLAIAADQVVMTMDIHEGVESLTRQFAESNLDQRRSEINTWLSAPDPFPNHVASRKKRQALTGNWFLNGKQYRHWKLSPGSLLWLYGIPGCGKSVLCSSIIEDLVSQFQSNSSVAVVYYYFDFNDIGKRDVESLVRALVAQLLVECPADSEYLENLFCQTQGRQPDIEFLSQTLKDFIPAFEQTYLVIDALDECSECEQLMKFIEEIHEWGSDQLHILVTSRQLPEIEETVAKCATESICLQDSNISEDITMLIHERLNSDRKFQKWPSSVKSEIEDALTEGAFGMFRWVVCQLDMLRNSVTLHALRKALGSLPKTLDETYERILANIDESYASDVQKILQYLTFSSRPMSLAEMVEVLAIDWDREEPQFDPENRTPDPMDVLTMCSTLVTTSEVMGYQARGEAAVHTSIILRLAHFSVKEFLISERIKASKTFMYSMNPVSANLFIARTYLIYLLAPQFSAGHCDWKTVASRRNNWPLLQAATHLWPEHIEAVDGNIDVETKQLIQRFFATWHNSNGGNYSAWVGTLIPKVALQTILDTPPLYYAASFGMTSVVKMLLSDMPKSQIDLKGGRVISTPLHVACFRGKVEVVKLLLEAGANPNSTNRRGESCLHWAWHPRKGKKNKKIYDLLIKFGAKTRCEGRKGGDCQTNCAAED